MNKKLISTILCIILLMVQIPANLFAEVAALKINDVAYDPIYYPEAKYAEFSLACDHDAMLYGDPIGNYEDKTYQFSEKKLYVESNGKRSVLVNQDGDNINISGDTLYFTTFENGSAYIKSVDLKTDALSTIMSAGSEQIRHFYVVNDDTMMYLAGGIVYQCGIDSTKAERISPKDDVFSFLPTDSGNLYAVGELLNYTMYLDDVHLLDNTSYYGVMEDHFVATVDGTLYQIPMKVLRALCQQASEQSKADTAQLLPYMTEFDLYGIYDVAELLNLDDPDRTCAYCEGAEGHQENDYYDSTVMPDAGSQALERTPTNAGLMILNQSKDLTGHTWTPKKAVYSCPRDGVITTFASNKTQTGIPYSRGARFSSTQYEGYQRCIVLNSNAIPDLSKPNTGDISLACFDREINDSSSKIYTAAVAYPSSGPFYGMDCSAFLSYCWGIKSHVGTSNFANPSNNPYCTKLSVSSSSLGILEVGDALISTGDDSHCVFISKIPLNADGSIGSIQITEETPPKTVTRPLTVAKFCSEFLNNGYSAYRFNYKTLTFNANGGVVFPRTMKVVPNIPYSYGDGLPKATRSGYTFMGWYTASSGGTKVTNSSVNSGSNQTLYAHWIMESIVEGIAGDTRISLTTNNARD